LLVLAADESVEVLEDRTGRPVAGTDRSASPRTGTSWHLPNCARRRAERGGVETGCTSDFCREPLGGRSL